MSDNFVWREGRQKTGYQRMKIFTISWPIHFDCYILRMKPGASVKPHKDLMRGKWRNKKAYRLNLIMNTPDKGGEFLTEKSIIDWPQLKLFRPDIYTHEVTTVEGNKTRYVLSLGVAVNDNKHKQ